MVGSYCEPDHPLLWSPHAQSSGHPAELRRHCSSGSHGTWLGRKPSNSSRWDRPDTLRAPQELKSQVRRISFFFFFFFFWKRDRKLRKASVDLQAAEFLGSKRLAQPRETISIFGEDNENRQPLPFFLLRQGAFVLLDTLAKAPTGRKTRECTNANIVLVHHMCWNDLQYAILDYFLENS